MNIGRLQIVLLLTGCLVARVTIAQQEAQPKTQQSVATPVQDEDPVTVFVPKSPRGDRDRDQITAASLFAHGRLLFQQQKFAQALSRYQRAWRYDPSGVSILKEIVPLSLRLKHNDEAVRYAVIAAEKDPTDLERMRRIASVLRQQRQFPRALKLYELIDQVQGTDTLDFKYVSLQLELGKLYFLTNTAKSSATALGHVKDALANPKKYGLNDQQKKQLEGKDGSTYQVIAESMLMAGKPGIAEAMFREVHRLKPDETLLAFRLARTLEKQGQPGKALAQLDTFMAAKTSDQGLAPYKLLEQLIKQQLKNDTAAAKRHLEKTLELHLADPDNMPLTFHLAQAHSSQGNQAEARKLFEALLDKKPTLDAYRGLVSILITRLAKGLENQPKDKPLKWSEQQQADWQDLSKHLATFLGGSGSLDPLDEALTAQIFDNKRFLSALMSQLRSQLNLEVGDDTAGKEPANIQTLALTAGLMAVRAKQWDDADAFFARALEAAGNKPAPVFEVWGLQMLMAEQFNRSAEVLQQAVEHPGINNKRSFYFLLAGAYEMADQTDKALVVARKAVETSPKLPRIHSRVAWVYYHSRRYAEAEQQYQALLTKFGSEYNSADTRDVLRQARLTLSNLCVLQDRNAEAEEWLEKVLDEYPEDIGALNDLGYLWADQNKHLHRAVEMIQTAVNAEPDNIAYRDSLGWAYYRLGDYPRAVKELEKAAADPEPDSVILEHLGDSYFKIKNIKKARATWQRALDALDETAKDSDRKKLQDKLNSSASE
ncbi:MAG: tetratricopeptide repeat protein [Planctomycetaceae bacterium]|nr:tetratricopeptide repeat protein [Planctomycetaceae bacterium]